MDAYCHRVGKESGSLQFLFDGDRISPDSTPNDIGMADEDEIDVIAGNRMMPPHSYFGWEQDIDSTSLFDGDRMEVPEQQDIDEEKLDFQSTKMDKKMEQMNEMQNKLNDKLDAIHNILKDVQIKMNAEAKRTDIDDLRNTMNDINQKINILIINNNNNKNKEKKVFEDWVEVNDL